MVKMASRAPLFERRTVKRIDFPFVLIVVLLIAGGLFAINSAAQGALHVVFRKQIIWYVIGVIPLLTLAFIDPKSWAGRWKMLYLINVTLLAIVDFTGHEAKGAQRWILLPGNFQFQPSEFAKLMTILTLASLLVRMKEDIKTGGGLLRSLMHIALPAFLIFKQPDLGTALVIFAIWVGMSFVAGARALHLAAVLVAGLIAFTGMWEANIIKDYQKKRMQAFINPNIDPKVSGYHVLQSRIAVGSGQLMGKGYDQGSQKKGRFIPEQHTDFIFTVIAEEGGFIGTTLLLAIFCAFHWRIWTIIANAQNLYYQLVGTGIFTLFLFHTTVNIGMTIGLAPVVGVPLPFISYGGSITLVGMGLIGLLLGIRAREEQLLF